MSVKLIEVRAAPGAVRGRLRCGAFAADCALGRAGIVAAAIKREGDGATPAGRYPIIRGFWRADRLARPATGLPLTPLAPDTGWCDDPSDPAYNRPVRLPHAAQHEKLWRTDSRYDLLFVIAWNLPDPVPGRGSAIFLHMTDPDLPPTEGCVALSRPDLLALAPLLGPDAAIDIGTG